MCSFQILKLAHLLIRTLRTTQLAFEKFLKLGKATVFQHIFDLQHLVSSLAFSTTIPPKVTMDLQYQKFFIVGQNIAYIDRHRAGVQDSFARFWAGYKSLTGGLEPLFEAPSDGVILDDLASENRGYACYVDKHWVRGGDINAFLYHMIERRRLAYTGVGGVVSLDRAGCRQLMLDIERMLEEPWHFAFQHTTAVHFRVQQLMQHRLINGDRPRNLLLPAGKMIELTRANKDSNVSEHDSCIANFYCKAVQDITMEVVCGGIRHALVVLAAVCYGEDVAQIYRE